MIINIIFKRRQELLILFQEQATHHLIQGNKDLRNQKRVKQCILDLKFSYDIIIKKKIKTNKKLLIMIFII